MLALGPMDEYAELDRVGVRLDPVELYQETYNAEQGPAGGGREGLRQVMSDLDRQSGVRRRRAWRVGVPAGQAARAGDTLFPARLGWQKAPGMRFRQSAAGETWSVETLTYTNDETGDAAAVSEEARRGGDRLSIEVSQSEASFGTWTRLTRWARRGFLR